MVGRIRTLALGAALLDVPVVVTEQYPRGLGPTVAELYEALAGAEALEKALVLGGGRPGFDASCAASAAGSSCSWASRPTLRAPDGDRLLRSGL